MGERLACRDRGDSLVAIAEAFERASVACARFKPQIRFEYLEGDHALD
jgi:hypothetical protein